MVVDEEGPAVGFESHERVGVRAVPGEGVRQPARAVVVVDLAEDDAETQRVVERHAVIEPGLLVEPELPGSVDGVVVQGAAHVAFAHLGVIDDTGDVLGDDGHSQHAEDLTHALGDHAGEFEEAGRVLGQPQPVIQLDAHRISRSQDAPGAVKQLERGRFE
ncbi:hypothetical protein ACWD25_26525 [Streptomyces sp. NPDC002920]